MLNRMFVSDMQDEISAIQSDLKHLANEQAAGEQKPPSDCWTDKNRAELFDNAMYAKSATKIESDSVISGSIGDSIDEKKFSFNKEMDGFVASKMVNEPQLLIKNEMKVEPQLDSMANNFNHMHPMNKMMPYKDMSIQHNSLDGVDEKPITYQALASHKENPLSSIDMTNFGYDLSDTNAASDDCVSDSDGIDRAIAAHKAHMPGAFNDVKKELDDLDIESEITPSFIIKKSERDADRNAVHSPLSSSDFDYLCSSNDNDATNSTANSQRKDDVISCDKEPYDEWLCIQKELNLMSDKRANELHMGGFMQASFSTDASNGGEGDANERNANGCSAADKLNVERELSDLLSDTGHNLDATKSSIDDNQHHQHHQHHHHHHHLPLTDLFSDSMVNNSIDAGVKDAVENMFSEDDETSDLVESRLEELFHGTSPIAVPTDNPNQSLR